MPETALSTGNAGEGSGASQAGAIEQTQDKAKDVADQAQEKAHEAGEQVRGRVREQVDQRSTQAGEQIRDGAGDVRSFAEQLREQGKDKPARYAEQAADRAERVGNYMSESDGERILHDVEDFGRRNPWAVVAGGVALGFMASRLLKASSTERYRSLPQRSGATGQGNGSASSYGSSIEPHGATGSPPSQFEPNS